MHNFLASLALIFSVLIAMPSFSQGKPKPKFRIYNPPIYSRDLINISVLVEQVPTDDCGERCRYYAIVLDAVEASSPSSHCFQDVVLGTFNVAGEHRNGVILSARAKAKTEPHSGELIAVLLATPKSDRQKIKRQLCTPPSDAVLAKAPEIELTFLPTAGTSSAYWARPAATTLEQILAWRAAGIQERNPYASYSMGPLPLRPWQTTGWWTVDLSSTPVGATIMMRGEPLGYDTNKILRLQPEMLESMSVHIGRIIVPIKSCAMTRRPKAGVDIKIDCSAKSAPLPPPSSDRH